MRETTTHERPGAPPGDEVPSDRIQALSRGLQVLEYVHGADRPVGVKQIAAGVGLHLATTYRLVNTLVYGGYLVRHGDRLLTLGRLPGKLTGYAAAPIQRALGRAAYAVDDVAVLARLSGATTSVKATAEVPGASCARHYSSGTAGLSHLLAVGRVILAHQDAAVIEATIELTPAGRLVAG